MTIAPPLRIEVSIKPCSQCWQLYKEYFAVDEATHQARSRFLVPGEQETGLGYSFSSAEADAARAIDFSAVLSPGLEEDTPTPYNH